MEPCYIVGHAPIHKEGIKSDPEHCREICVMNTLKLLHLMMNERMVNYLEKNNIINMAQIGFQREQHTNIKKCRK